MGFTTPSLSRSLTILATKHAHCKRRNTSTNCIISLSAMSPLARPWRWPSISYKITETVTTRSSKRNFVNSTSLVRGLDVMAPRQQEERVDCLSLPVHVVNENWGFMNCIRLCHENWGLAWMKFQWRTHWLVCFTLFYTNWFFGRLSQSRDKDRWGAWCKSKDW